MSNTNWNGNYDQNGNIFYYDQNGYPYYLDQNGTPYYYDQNGYPYYIDATGTPQYYNQPVTHGSGRTVVHNDVVVKVPKNHSGIKALLITLLILCVLVVGAGFANKYLVEGPEQATRGFIAAFNNMDIKKMISYCEEKDRRAFEAELGIIGMAGDLITGLPFSGLMGSAMDLAPLLGEEYMPHIDILAIEDITYYYDTAGMEPASNIFGFFELNKLWCDRADVLVRLRYEDEIGVEKIILVREGFGQWKISSESSGGGDILGLGKMLESY